MEKATDASSSCKSSNIVYHLGCSCLRNIHLSSIVSKDHESSTSSILSHQRPTIAPFPVRHGVFIMRLRTPGCNFEPAAGGKISEEGFESESAAAYKSGVYLEDPIEMSTVARILWRKANSHPEHVLTIVPYYVACHVSTK